MTTVFVVFCLFFFLQPAVFNIGPIEAQPLCVLNKLIRKPVKIFCFFVLFCDSESGIVLLDPLAFRAPRSKTNVSLLEGL